MQRRVGALAIAVVLGAGCRAAGLPEPPPGRDPADPESAIPSWRPASNPLEESAFGADEPAGEATHEGHGHGHHHHGADPEPSPPPEAEPAPENAEPSRPVDDEPPKDAPR